MNNELLQVHIGTQPLTWEAIYQDHIFYAINESENKLKAELGTENFFVLPMGSFLNLRAMAEIADIQLNKHTIPLLLNDIDILTITDILSPEQEAKFYNLVERLDPIINRFLRINTGIELCWVYNLQLHPVQFDDPDAYTFIPEETTSEAYIEAAELTIASIKRALEAINMSNLLGKGDYYEKFLQTLDISFTKNLNGQITPGFLNAISAKLRDPVVLSYNGNFLQYVASTLYEPGFPALKLKHIKRALKIKYKTQPSDYQVRLVASELSFKGYRIQEK